jgi:hypothetical protein
MAACNHSNMKAARRGITFIRTAWEEMVLLRTIPCSVAALLLAACSSNNPAPKPDIPPNCSRPVATSAMPAAQVVLHETHKTGDDVWFAVPPGTGSVTILHQAQTANLRVVYKNTVIDNSAVPGQVFKPDTSRAYDDNDPAFAVPPSPDGGTDPSGLYAFYGGGSPSTAAFTMPNTAFSLDAGVPAGNWHFIVNDYAYECAQANSGCTDGGVLGNSYDVTVLARPAPAAGAAAKLDVAFYIVAAVTSAATGKPLNAANAATDPAVQRMVNTFQNIYKQVGITVSTPVFYDVSSANVTRFGTHINADTTGPCDELDQMFLLSADHPGNTLNLFLVQSITSKSNGGGSVVGIDGTIPGPASFAGTVHSGAAVSMADLFSASTTVGDPTPCQSVGMDLNCGADVVAYIAAHEAGHFLGMFHTTEAEGRDFDPITDTPKCPCLSCASSTDRPNCVTGGSASNPIFLKANQCVNPSAGCGGGDNLMFWQLSQSVSQGNLSPQQGAVMRLNPAVHP